ncbi:MAG: hypothetical protein CL694_01265 [Chloroflexi bacterium]|nr:hypothetical protein [Chloroflexota bacterium]HAL48311.1 hypothetical protein [Dehalococcoidia bacterium]
MQLLVTSIGAPGFYHGPLRTPVVVFVDFEVDLARRVRPERERQGTKETEGSSAELVAAIV